MALKENYKDDILDTSQNVKRKYQMENNGDGTVSFTDVTEYTQQGDSFGSGDINATNSKVNTIDSAVTALDANLDGFKFYPTGTGIVGLIADDSAYTDEDGNYVVWGTATANQLVEDNPNTYKSVPSEEDLRGKVGADTATPFSSKEPFVAICSLAYASGADVSSMIRIKSRRGYDPSIGYTDKIDVTKFKKMYIDWETTKDGNNLYTANYVGLSNDTGKNTNFTVNIFSNWHSRRTDEIDISNIQGQYRIKIICVPYSSDYNLGSDIYKVWFE